MEITTAQQKLRNNPRRFNYEDIHANDKKNRLTAYAQDALAQYQNEIEIQRRQATENV